MIRIKQYVPRLQLSAAMLLAGFLLWGCNAPEDKSIDNQKAEPSPFIFPEFPSVETDDVYAYVCGDSLQFTAHVTRDSSWLFLPDTALKVTPRRSASGVRFASGPYFYWSKGDSALLQLPDQALRSCWTIPQEKSWQAAKIRGVDFRALGQEPGWHLEITDGKQFKYVGNYGQDTVETRVPEPQVDEQQGQKVYQAKTEAHTLTVEISDEPCSDVMSGFEFPLTVTVSVDGETYWGCGRNLRFAPPDE